MTTSDNQEWSCGTCTFLNKPLFLSCEMCGQARPSQRPNPPRRQPSMPLDQGRSVPCNVEEHPNRSVDRAPRSVQRYRSTINITGTLVMTDDPADYETQDGKKPGEVKQGSEPNQDVDPSLDESLERHLLEVTRSNSNTASHSLGYQPGDRDNHIHQAPPTTRKAYPTVGGISFQTIQTAHMGSSSRGMQIDELYQGDAGSMSSGRYSNGVVGSQMRRHIAMGRPRAAVPCQDNHYHRSSNGLPVITREPPTPNRHQYHHQGRNGSSGASMGDSSSCSHYSCGSHESNSIRSPVTPRRAMGMSSAASTRYIKPEAASARYSGLRRGSSLANLPSNDHQLGSDFLPSLAPSPVLVLDSPGDVDVMAVFVQDSLAADRATNRRKSAAEARKERGKMLDNLSVSGVIPTNCNVSCRSLVGTGSGVSVGLSSPARWQQSSQRLSSTRSVLLGAELQVEDQVSVVPSAMILDTEALDSPNTRRERRKEKRRMKGAVRTLMATMRMGSLSK